MTEAHLKMKIFFHPDFLEHYAYALCRPPGHHASADSCWGFCYFNNIAIDDWGGMLTANDFYGIGNLLANFAREKCGNRLFAALEGGYNARALAKNIDSFLQGLQK